MKDLVDKAEVLIEALPYMRRFVDRTIVIKYGGHAMTDDELRALVRRGRRVDFKFIGVAARDRARRRPADRGHPRGRLGVQSEFVDGLRVTDDQTMEVVEMVLGGKLNREIVEDW